MIRICAWCKADMGTKEPLEDTRVTHAMCKACEFNLAEELRQADKENLEKLAKQP